MYAGGRGAARLLLVVAFVVAVKGLTRWPRLPRSKQTRVYRPNKDAAKLLKHVMMNEEEWSNVLQEPIKMLGEPPHKGREFDAPRLGPQSDHSADEADLLYDVREIAATVTRYYSGIRSFVEYGAKAVRRALGCYTFKQVLYQLSSITQLMIKEVEPIVVLNATSELRKNMVSYIDVMSATYDEDLFTILRAYWNSVKVMQYDGIQRLKTVAYPEALKDTIINLTKNVSKFLKKNCVPYSSDADCFQRLGIPMKNPLIKDPSIDTFTPIEDIKLMTEKQSQHMAQSVHDMGIVTMPNHLWTSLFYYRGRPLLDSTHLDIVAPMTSEPGPSTSADGSSTIEGDPSEASSS